MTKDEALKLALEALELHGQQYPHMVKGYCLDAITAIREALAEQPAQQEPVAWLHNFIKGNVIAHKPADIDRHSDRWTALYKDPTPCKTCQSLAMAVMNDQIYHEEVIAKREWVGLADEEIMDRWPCETRIEFARWIEAKLKEKNT